MPPNPEDARRPIGSFDVAEQLAKALDERGCEYALGGAIALSYWAEPRGTMDVDLTLFLPPDKPGEVVWMLQEVGCDVVASEAVASIQEHGFCQCTYAGFRVDVFVPIVPFYEQARLRRRSVDLGDSRAMVWDPETLAVFKLMFFRRKDIADLEEILRQQSPGFDCNWVREQVVEMYGVRDPRVTQWDQLVSEVTR